MVAKTEAADRDSGGNDGFSGDALFFVVSPGEGGPLGSNCPREAAGDDHPTLAGADDEASFIVA